MNKLGDSTRAIPRPPVSLNTLRFVFSVLTSSFPYIVAEQDALVTQVESAAGDNRVGPGGSVASIRLIEAALLAVPFGSGPDQAHGAAIAVASRSTAATHSGVAPAGFGA